MSSDIETLLENVKAGKPLSFDVIYELYIPLIESTVQNYCKRYAISESEADDIRQEALIALYNAAIAYDTAKNVTFGAYAKVCIRNRIASYIRCLYENDSSELLSERETEFEEPDFDTPEQIVINKESLCTLNHRIDETLTEFERSVFALYVGNMSVCLAFRDDGKIGVKALKNAQFFFDDFNGFAGGEAEKEQT